jgi:hypothetical protein
MYIGGLVLITLIWTGLTAVYKKLSATAGEIKKEKEIEHD